MTQTKKNSNRIKTATQWKVRAAENRANRKQINRAQKFALELLDYLEDHKITQKELAIRMAVSPQQVNKIIRAKANLTFETVDKVAEALGVTITSPTIVSKPKIQSLMITSSMTLVHKAPKKEIEANFSKNIGYAKNSILETTLESVEKYAYTADQI